MDVEDGAGWRVVPGDCGRAAMGKDRMNRMCAVGRGAAHGAPAAGRIGCGGPRLEALATRRLGWLRYVRRAAG